MNFLKKAIAPPLRKNRRIFAAPKENRSSTGFIISSSAERFEDASSVLQINIYNYAGSYLYSFSRNLKKGPMARVDVGFSRGATVLDLSSNNKESQVSMVGFGGLLGFGYNQPVGSDNYMTVMLQYSAHLIEDQFYQTFRLTGGIFW